ncbi:MAG: PilZ domain-containing protein [Candidatus Abyssobacteria bacterium SURF_17]|uniref:PilZ domain-containing protein n=1 Tax=Candidatus Abyssobacteria bacterium SURF_17 TaxID=2093361 RepID=A0A419EMR9_9BACT|nr:MAG: PilZ domain-containing protein [Candidatus Abyssubacteria bacterium SURF_17]
MDKEKEPVTGERRRYVRYACKMELKAILDFNPDVARRTSGKLPPIVFRRGETAVARDISEKGIAIETERFLPEGMIIKIAVENPFTPPIETDARIVWSKKLPGEKRGYILGMAFRHMRDKHRRNLEHLLEFLEEIPE